MKHRFYGPRNPGESIPTAPLNGIIGRTAKCERRRFVPLTTRAEMQSLSAQRLRALIAYDPNSGEFRWLHRSEAEFSSAHAAAAWNARWANELAGSVRHDGYWRVQIDSVRYLAHRLAWLWTYGEWPANKIDHINGNPSDNRISNLRDVTVQVNTQNQRRAQRHSKTGYLGVTHGHGGKFKATLGLNGRTIVLGSFETPEAAHAAYVLAKQKHHAGCTLGVLADTGSAPIEAAP